MNSGKVILVGAGPGDEGLLTIRGKNWIERADVIFYDHLVNIGITRYAKPDVELIYAGKSAGKTTMDQEEINTLLIEKAQAGKIVVRLKGGDPFIFGRGGEEAQALKNAGVSFVVVPGVTSPVGVSAYAGIPLTHRDFASTVSIITGSIGKGHGADPIDWEALARWPGTLVFLMGARKLKLIADNLTRNGKDPQTPIAVIQWGATPKQKTWSGTLQSIGIIAEAKNIQPPALTIVGKVVDLKSSVDWYEIMPLFGKTIVVTRPKKQAEGLIRLLEEKGADPYSIPIIETIVPDDFGPLDESLSKLDSYDGVIFTSVNGVDFFMKRLLERNMDIRDLKNTRIYVIGPKTADAVRNLGIRVDVVPQEYVAESLLDSFSEEDVSGKRFLIPRALIARETLPDKLRERGAIVDVSPAYKTIQSEVGEKDFFEKLKEGNIDAVTFTSSSTVTHFMSIVKDVSLLSGVTLACIGPVTAKTARNLGLRVDVIAKRFTVEGLVQGLERHFIDHSG